MTRRTTAVMLALVLLAALTGCSSDDAATSSATSTTSSNPCPSGTPSAVRVLVLGDSNLYESNDVVAATLTKAGFAPTLRGISGYGLLNLDSYWLGQLPALLADDPAVVVVALGTNDTTTRNNVEKFPARFDEMMAALGDRPVVWLTHVDPRPAQVSNGAATVNAVIREAPARWPNLTVVDRTPVLDADPSLVRDDHLHFTPKGMQSFADAIRDGATSALPAVATIPCGSAS